MFSPSTVLPASGPFHQPQVAADKVSRGHSYDAKITPIGMTGASGPAQLSERDWSKANERPSPAYRPYM